MREWLDEQPGQSFFFTGEIPGWAPALRSTLARVAADPGHPVVRVARGLCCKRWHESWPAHYRLDFVDSHLGALRFASAGAGPANWQALNLVGWTAQHRWRNDFGCVARPPRSPWRHTRFVQRSKERCRELSWAEVTLLEALRMFDHSDLDWDAALETVSCGEYLGRLRYDAEVDSERLRWAAHGEARQPNAFRERADSLCSALPRFDSFETWRSRPSAHG